MTGTRAPRADALRNRAAIVAAARSAFVQGEQLRFDDFAARAGVGVGTLYRHFPTREALAAAVYRGEVAALCDRALDASRSPGENLDAFLRGFVGYLIGNAGLAHTLAAVVDPAIQADGGDELERTVTELMARAAAEGAIHDRVPPGAVMVVLHGIGSAVGRAHWASESRAAVELLIAGMTAGGATGASPRR